MKAGPAMLSYFGKPLDNSLQRQTLRDFYRSGMNPVSLRLAGPVVTVFRKIPMPQKRTLNGGLVLLASRLLWGRPDGLSYFADPVDLTDWCD